MSTPARPNPDDFDDYRVYLRAMTAYLKATRPQFSYRYFARTAGFASPNFLKLVEQGARNLSQRSITKFAKGLGLDSRERDVFETLVLLGQAQTDEERNRYFAKLRRKKSRVGVHRIEGDALEFDSQWPVLAIRELVADPAFVEDPSWIAEQLLPRIAPSEAKAALELLERVGLLVRDDAGRLALAAMKISTGPRVRSLALRNYHRAMLELASGTLDTVAQDKRDVTGLTLRMNADQYEHVRQRIGELRRELLDYVDDAPTPNSAEVYQVEFALFPMTRREP